MFKQLKAMGLAASLLVAAGPSLAQEVSWQVPTSVPEGSPFYVNFLERFADNVDVLTSGRVEIEPFGAGVLVPALQVYDGVRDGIVKAGHSTPSYRVNQDPINAIFAGFPGGMGPEAYITWIYEDGGKEALYELRAKEGFKSLVVGLLRDHGPFQRARAQGRGPQGSQIPHLRPVGGSDERIFRRGADRLPPGGSMLQRGVPDRMGPAVGQPA